MVLSDRDILGAMCDENPLVIDPYDEKRVQPASIDLTLSNEFMRYQSALERIVENPTEEQFENLVVRSIGGRPVVPPPIRLSDVKEQQPIHKNGAFYTLEPGAFALASTEERVEIPDWLVARVEGKSSLGRIGLLIHATAGFIDPGFKGKITLEMYNLNDRPIILEAGRPICQLSILKLSSAAEFPYGHEKLGSSYQDQRAVTASRYKG